VIDPTSGARRFLPRELAGAVLVYLALAVLLTASVWRDPSNQWIGDCCDQEQAMWYLAWLPTAIESGQNPLVTEQLNAPDGANLMWNKSKPLAALLAAPLTRARGPILSYNVIVVIAIALSGLAGYAALRRLTNRPLSALVGGGLYAFSPYMASHTALHISLLFAWAPPLILILLDELLVRHERRPAPLGVALGILGGLQLLLNEEMLATLAVAGATLALIVAATVRDRFDYAVATRRAAAALGPALLAFLVIGAAPLAVQFLGPDQIHGQVLDTTAYSTDLLNLVLPTTFQLVAPQAATAISSGFSGLSVEATAYVGVPLLLLLTWLVASMRRDRRVVIAGVFAIVMFILSLGPELHVGGVDWHWPLPGLLINGLPLMNSAVPGRLTVYVWLAIAALIGLAIDGALAGNGRRAAARLTLIGLALVFVAPKPLSTSTTAVPEFFRTWNEQGVASDQTILVAPWFYDGAGAAPMLWAAVAEARPRLYEGYVYVPGPDGRAQYGPRPGPVGNLMIDIQDNGTQPVLSDADRVAARQQLTTDGISVVLVGPMGHRDAMVALFTDLLGVPPVETGGVELWRDVPALLRGTGSGSLPASG
jgi:hypothetical protein